MLVDEIADMLDDMLADMLADMLDDMLDVWLADQLDALVGCHRRTKPCLNTDS